MGRYIVRRLLQGIPLLFIYSVPVIGLLFTTVMALGQAVLGRDSAFSVSPATTPAQEAL